MRARLNLCMMFRCRVENGRIELPAGLVIPDGTEVNVQPINGARRSAPVRASAALRAPHPVFGMWKHRRDFGADPVSTLRAASRKRRTGKAPG